MKKILLTFITAIFLISCAKSEDSLSPSNVTYIVESEPMLNGSVIYINLMNTGNFGSTEPSSVSYTRFEMVKLPFTFTIENYYPDRMEVFIYLSNNSDYDKLKVKFLRDGELIAETNSLKQSHPLSFVSFSYKWGK